MTINVTFSQPVVAFGGPPVLVLDVGKLYRDATLVGGNGTATLVFQYVVRVGDYAITAQGVSWRYTPNALCSKSGCPSDGSAAIVQARAAVSCVLARVRRSCAPAET
jgi:hypothetical protein